MSNQAGAVDAIYIAASTDDARYTRICVASVRHFYPEVPIRLLVGGPLQRGLVNELRHYWAVDVADIPKGDYGWGFVKLEPLFGPAGERFLVLDSDTVMTGPVLGIASQHDDDLIVDDEEQTPERAKAIYVDRLKAVEQGHPIADHAFLFNTGQWFGRSGILRREDFRGLVEWGFPRTLTNPGVFKNGEQGILNHVVNEQWRAGKITVARIPLMRWAGHGMHGLDVQAISSESCPSLVVHWAGMKRARRRDMVGADVLTYFEYAYYKALPAGAARRIFAGSQHAFSEWAHGIQVRARQASRRIISAPSS